MENRKLGRKGGLYFLLGVLKVGKNFEIYSNGFHIDSDEEREQMIFQTPLINLQDACSTLHYLFKEYNSFCYSELLGDFEIVEKNLFKTFIVKHNKKFEDKQKRISIETLENK